MKLKNVLSTIILVMIVSLTVGFSAFVSEMSISNIVADIRAQKDVRITDAQLLEGDVIPNNLNYSVDSVIGDVIFNSTDASATYKIQITNFGNVDVYFNGYAIEELSGANFECLDGCGEVIIPGLGNTVDVTFLLINDGNTSGSFKVNFDFKRIFNVSFEGLDFSNDVAYENDRYTKYIGSEYKKNNIRIYMDGVLIPSSSYEVDYGQLTIYDVTGDLVIESVKVDAKLMSGSLDTVGSEVCIGNEFFYIICNDGTTVSMLSKYNLHVGSEYNANTQVLTSYGDSATGMQDSAMLGYAGTAVRKGITKFSSESQKGTKYSDYNGSVLEGYVNNYQNLLESNFGVDIKSSRLITNNELVNVFKCSTTKNTCSGSPYPWIYSTSYWTGSAYDDENIWFVSTSPNFAYSIYSTENGAGVRPVIEILEEDIVNSFEVKVVSGNVNTAGSEVCLGTECFYVLSSTNDSVTMLSKYNLYVGNSVDEEWNITPLSNPTGIQDKRALGWYEEDDGPVFPVIGTVSFGEDGSTYETSTIKGYVDDYGDYLRSLGFDITSSRLLSFDEIIKFPHETGVEHGNTEYYFSDSNSWIRSTSYWVWDTDGNSVYRMDSLGNLYIDDPTYEEELGVRPVITVSKSIFN